MNDDWRECDLSEWMHACHGKYQLKDQAEKLSHTFNSCLTSEH